MGRWMDWSFCFNKIRELRAIFFQPTLSYRINNKLGIGAGFVYANGKVNLQKDIPVIDQNGNYGHAELSGKASGFGFNLGVYYTPIEKLSIGLTHRSKVDMKGSNRWRCNFYSSFFVSSKFPKWKIFIEFTFTKCNYFRISI